MMLAVLSNLVKPESVLDLNPTGVQLLSTSLDRLSTEHSDGIYTKCTSSVEQHALTVTVQQCLSRLIHIYEQNQIFHLDPYGPLETIPRVMEAFRHASRSNILPNISGDVMAEALDCEFTEIEWRTILSGNFMASASRH